MKLTCQRGSLISAFQVVSGVVPTRTTRDILKNVKLQVEQGVATLMGTDTEIGIRYQLSDVDTDSAGEILLPTSRVISILRELSGDTVEFDVADSIVQLKSGGSRFKLSLEDPSEYPDVPEFHGEDYFTMSGHTLKKMIKRSIFAADDESTRYALGGVLVEFQREKVTFAATDSRRLAVIETTCGVHGDVPAKLNPVVPRKAMNLIERSVSDDDQEVKIAIHGNDILVKSNNSTIYSRLVEGRFPNFRDVLPKGSDKIIEMVAAPFYASVRQSQIVTNDESRGVDFQFSEGTATLKSKAAEVGESTIELPVSYTGEEVAIMFDPRYVADFLKVLEPEAAIQLKLISSNEPAMFQAGDDYSYVVMPLARD
jgi:DNA polymerase-3 subunit beta